MSDGIELPAECLENISCETIPSTTGIMGTKIDKDKLKIQRFPEAHQYLQIGKYAQDILDPTIDR